MKNMSGAPESWALDELSLSSASRAAVNLRDNRGFSDLVETYALHQALESDRRRWMDAQSLEIHGGFKFK